jgi:hypothetical protein
MKMSSLELSSDEVPEESPATEVNTEKDNIATPEASAEESDESGETYATTDDEAGSESEQAPDVKDAPTKKGARERAFKEIDFAANDPILLDHRTERRALAKKLEEDPEFREAYIAREEKLRKQREEEEEEYTDTSSINDADINEAIRTVHKMQGNYESSEEASSPTILEGVSDDGSVDMSSSYHSSDYKRKRKSKKKSKKGKKGKKGTARIGINIENLVIKKLVFKL